MLLDILDIGSFEHMLIGSVLRTAVSFLYLKQCRPALNFFVPYVGLKLGTVIFLMVAKRGGRGGGRLPRLLGDTALCFKVIVNQVSLVRSLLSRL